MRAIESFEEALAALQVTEEVTVLLPGDGDFHRTYNSVGLVELLDDELLVVRLPEEALSLTFDWRDFEAGAVILFQGLADLAYCDRELVAA